MKPIITFANWGNYTVLFKGLCQELGIEAIPPEKTNQKAIVEGAKVAPEMYCFPLKVNLGNYLEAIKKGANTVLMATASGGSCRLRYYGVVQEKVLRDAGYDVKFIIFDQSITDIYKKIKEISNLSFRQILKVAISFYKKLRFIEELEKRADFLRPREIKKGETDKVFQESLKKIESSSPKDFKKVKKEILKRFSEIKFEKKETPKVGLVGEIYTVCDPTVNFEIERKLGNMGIEVHREISLSYHLKKKIFFKDSFIQRKIKPYLKSTVGGHGRDAIYEMLKYIKEGFDGVIQLLPAMCVVGDTKITVENYLQKSIQEIKVGEKVLTHKGRFRKVTHKFCRNYRGKILKIDCGGKLLTISVTPEHPILSAKAILRGNRTKEIQKLKFLPAYQLKKGDFVAIPIPKTVKNKDFFEWNKKYKKKPKWEDIKKFPYSPELLRMLGYWLAEGNIRWDKSDHDLNKIYKRGIVFSFSPAEKEYIDDVTEAIRKNFRARISQYISPRNTLYLDIGNRNLAEIVHCLCGSRCDQKVLHPDLLNLAPNLQKEILKGFFRGDGCFRDEYGETTYRGVTTSWNLASQLFWLLIRSRIKPSFLEQRIKNRKLSYVLKIATAHEIKRLEDEKIKVTNRKKFIKHRELNNYFLVPIRKIESGDFKGKVYNLEVEEDHSYVANFLAVHNCMPEVTVRPILEKLHLESGIPFLSISIDEEIAEAGVDTRIEAFVDIVFNHFKNKKI